MKLHISEICSLSEKDITDILAKPQSGPELIHVCSGMYNGNIFTELDAMLDRYFGADAILARQVKEWFQELDPFYFARPCWMHK